MPYSKFPSFPNLFLTVTKGLPLPENHGQMKMNREEGYKGTEVAWGEPDW